MSYVRNMRNRSNGGNQRFNNFGYNDFNNFSNAETLDPNNRTMTIIVANAATVTKSVRLFGAIKDLTDGDKDANVTITVSESSHLQVKNELMSGSAFRIKGAKMTVTAAGQFSNAITLKRETATGGGLEQRIVQPLTFRSAQNTITTQVDMPNFELLVDANVYLEFTANASETITFIFSIQERANLGNLLRGKSVKEVSFVRPNTGLPQLDADY